MNLQPHIVFLREKVLVGISINMSVANNNTPALWQRFMSRRTEVLNAVGKDLISLQIYDPDYFQAFSPQRDFVNWAAAEVNDTSSIPQGMDTMTIPAGLYAVFHYNGSSGDPGIFQYIYTDWLPKSEYELEQRPHFEVLGEKFKTNDPESEEEIWIPIRVA